MVLSLDIDTGNEELLFELRHVYTFMSFNS